MSEPLRRELTLEVDKYYRRFDTGCRWWSTAHHGSLFLAALLSVAAALLLKLESLQELQTRADIAAILAAVAGLLGTIAATGGFQRKWRANRLSRGRISQLQIDLTDAGADLTAIRAELKSILTAHDNSIVE